MIQHYIRVCWPRAPGVGQGCGAVTKQSAVCGSVKPTMVTLCDEQESAGPGSKPHRSSV